MRARTVLRLGAEVAFISVVAVIAHLADLSTAGIIVIMAVAWLLTAIAEGLVARGWQGVATFVPPVRPFSGGLQHREPAPAWESSAAPPEEIAPAWLESAEVLGVHVAGFEPVVEESEAEPVETEGAGPAAQKAGTPAAEEALRTARSRPSRRAKPPARPAAGPELGVTIEPEADAVADATEVLAAATEVTEASERSGEAGPDETGVQPGANLWPPPERRWPRRRFPGDGAEVGVGQRPEPDPQLEPEPESAAAALSSSAQGWNVWELERLARRLGEAGTANNEEWAFLLVYLREFADQNGVLPADLDALVRESFPELVAVAEPT